MSTLIAHCFRASTLLALAGTYPNHAPVWVFVLLAAIIAIVAIVLYFANTPGGGEQDYLYADPSNHYFGSPGGAGYGPFGGFRHL